MVQEIREMIRTVYGKYDVWLRALGKFSLAFGSLLVIRNFMGYLPLLDNILILLILALVASFLPLNGMVLICFVVILGELYGLSLPSLAVGGGLLLLVALLYFGLAPAGSPGFFTDTIGPGSSCSAGSSGGLRSSGNAAFCHRYRCRNRELLRA